MRLLTSQQAPEVFFFPLLCSGVVLEASLARPKRSGVIVAAPISHDRRHVVVQHLVEDDRFDEKTWDPGLVEHRMNPNQAFLRKVCPKLKRALPTFGLNALSPGDSDIHVSAEMPAPEVVSDRAEIVVVPL